MASRRTTEELKAAYAKKLADLEEKEQAGIDKEVARLKADIAKIEDSQGKLDVRAAQQQADYDRKTKVNGQKLLEKQHRLAELAGDSDAE